MMEQRDFGRLIEALSGHIRQGLDASSGTVVLARGDKSVAMIIEAGPGPEACTAIAPFGRLSGNRDLDTARAVALLKLNADREALGGIVLSVDSARGVFLALETLPLSINVITFLQRIEALCGLAQGLALHIATVEPEEMSASAPGPGPAGHGEDWVLRI
jgi:hypothetical protein